MYQQLFSLQENAFKVIANQKRLEIIQLLGNRELSVSEMTEMLGLPQANLSQHLASLRQAGIVMARRDGVNIHYHLTDQRIAEACGLIKDFLQEQHKFNPEVQELLEHQDDMYPVVKDVVCGMRISVSRAGEVIKHDNHTYYFCASGCKTKFETKPTKYVTREELVHGNR
jgi:ArsR family transcriptional regulator